MLEEQAAVCLRFPRIRQTGTRALVICSQGSKGREAGEEVLLSANAQSLRVPLLVRHTLSHPF